MEKFNYKLIYHRIDNLAKSKNMSMRQLAKYLGVANSTVSFWRKRMIGTKELYMLSRYFHVSMEYILGKTDNPNNKNDKYIK